MLKKINDILDYFVPLAFITFIFHIIIAHYAFLGEYNNLIKSKNKFIMAFSLCLFIFYGIFFLIKKSDLLSALQSFLFIFVKFILGIYLTIYLVSLNQFYNGQQAPVILDKVTIDEHNRLVKFRVESEKLSLKLDNYNKENSYKNRLIIPSHPINENDINFIKEIIKEYEGLLNEYFITNKSSKDYMQPTDNHTEFGFFNEYTGLKLHQIKIAITNNNIDLAKKEVEKYLLFIKAINNQKTLTINNAYSLSESINYFISFKKELSPIVLSEYKVELLDIHKTLFEKAVTYESMGPSYSFYIHAQNHPKLTVPLVNGNLCKLIETESYFEVIHNYNENLPDENLKEIVITNKIRVLNILGSLMLESNEHFKLKDKLRLFKNVKNKILNL